MPKDSLLYRAGVARELNSIMGTTRFDAWNVGEIPSDDLAELRTSLRWLQELRNTDE